MSEAMSNLMTLEGKTKTGELDFKLAAAACYVPMMLIHLVAATVFLATEPKEHRFVRFHAVQSLLMFAVFGGGSIAALVLGMVVFPLLVMVVGSTLAAIVGNLSDDLAALLMAVTGLISFVSYVGGALLSIALSLAFLPAFLFNALMIMSDKNVRWPVLGGLAERLV